MLGDILGGPERDLVYLRFPELAHEDASAADGASSAPEELSPLTVTVVDGAGKSALRFEDSTLPEYEWPTYVTIKGFPLCLTLATPTHLRRYTFSPESVEVASIPFPEPVVVLDSGVQGEHHQPFLVLVNADSLWTGLLRDGAFRWKRYDLPDSYYSSTLRQFKAHVASDPRPDELLDGCHLCVDVDGDGSEEILLPGPDAVSIARWTKDDALEMIRATIPASWRPRSVRRWLWQNVWQGQTDQISAGSREVEPYEITCGVGPNPIVSGGLCLGRSHTQGSFQILPLVIENGTFAFDPQRVREVPWNSLVTGDFIRFRESDLDWLTSSLRATWPYAARGEEFEWRIDIDGDGRRDYLSAMPRLTSAGPMAEMSYILAGPNAKWGDASQALGKMRKFRQATWLDPSDGGILDLDNDGALDLLFCEPDLNVLDIAKAIEGPTPVKLKYTLWLFDKSRRDYDPARKSSFVITHLFSPMNGRIVGKLDARQEVAWNLDFGDLNGDGLPDAVFMLNEDTLGLCLNTGEADRPLNPSEVIPLQLPPFDTFFVPDVGPRGVIVCWRQMEKSSTTLSAIFYSPEEKSVR